MSSGVKKMDSNKGKKKLKSVSKLYQGMVSSLFTGLKDLTTDSVPDPPRSLPASTGTENKQQAQFSDSLDRSSSPESPKQFQESDSSSSTPSFSRKKKTTKTDDRQQRKNRRQNGREPPPSDFKAAGNTFLIRDSHTIHIGTSWTQQVITNNETLTEPRIKKTPKIKGLLLDKTPINEEHLDLAATHIGKKWRIVGRKLNDFSDGQMDNFERQGKHNLKESIYQMLLAWTQECPKDATLGKLCSTLWENDVREAVSKIAENV